MIAQRFRPLGWVAGVAVAATALYMISLRVASERGRLETIDHKIASTQREIRQLQTELGTRASLRQLERWNSESFSMSAPQAGQYLPGERSLASVERDSLGNQPAAPPPVMAAVGAEVPVQAGEAAAVTSGETAVAAIVPVKPEAKLAKQVQTVRRADKQGAISDSKSQKQAAPIRVAMLDKSAIRDLARSANSETRRAPKQDAASISKPKK